MDLNYYLDITENFLQANWIFVLAGVIAVVVLVAVIALIVSSIRKHQPAENIDELESYIKGELEGGMSKENIEKNLEKTGWSKKEVESSFSNLNV